MNIIKKTRIPAMLGLVAIGLTTSLSLHADTLSDLRSQCVGCHNVIAMPSGWSLDGSASGRIATHDLAGWNATIASMGDGKCGFANVGPGGTSRSVAAQYIYNMSLVAATPTATTAVATATFTPTATATATATATFTPTATTAVVTPTFTPTATTAMATATFTPTATMAMATATFTPTATMAMATATFTPTATMAMASPTPTATVPPHAWYDYDYQKGRCFQKDHTISDYLWCEQHGTKGGGTHPSLTGYQRHAHLDFPGQKP